MSARKTWSHLAHRLAQHVRTTAVGENRNRRTPRRTATLTSEAISLGVTHSFAPCCKRCGEQQKILDFLCEILVDSTWLHLNCDTRAFFAFGAKDPKMSQNVWKSRKRIHSSRLKMGPVFSKPQSLPSQYAPLQFERLSSTYSLGATKLQTPKHTVTVIAEHIYHVLNEYMSGNTL